MRTLFDKINPKSKNKLSDDKKEQFEKIEKEYDRHDDGYVAEENKINHLKLSKQLKNGEKKQEETNSPTTMRPRN
ncbi:hypothetical protein [Legionella cincinnatiensis]|uniref:Uncharacterized protein n=1 Tax=Legionella cincinnatiensis TaxID=28085 RepID=A0A378IIE0_9GAMM|nr:hypothetical protein [Legionella cincinnatiensis]KTC83565.1 hypothetical protein Lcin_2252 [Legionella cincinnatiensis]STX34475.1 Uncharacterised protein [Legionella cincinnatiensis]